MFPAQNSASAKSHTSFPQKYNIIDLISPTCHQQALQLIKTP